MYAPANITTRWYSGSHHSDITRTARYIIVSNDYQEKLTTSTYSLDGLQNYLSKKFNPKTILMWLGGPEVQIQITMIFSKGMIMSITILYLVLKFPKSSRS